jgi:hypothetical protein
MRGPEEWPSRSTRVADRIRLTGPAATTDCNSDAVADTAPAVREVMKSLAGFKDTGKRMLAAWSEGVSVLRDSRMYGLSPWKSAAAFEGISDPPKLKNPRTVTGRSELLARRTKSKSK